MRARGLAYEAVDDGDVLRVESEPVVDVVDDLEQQRQRRRMVVREATPFDHLLRRRGRS